MHATSAPTSDSVSGSAPGSDSGSAAVSASGAASSSTRATVRAVEPSTVAQWLQRGDCVVCDVREPDEHAAERIEGAAIRPLSKLDLSGLDGSGLRIVFHCKGGVRSADAAARAIASLPGVEVCTMIGGLEAWKRAGLPTVRAERPPRFTVMQQTQMTIGAAVLAGLCLGWFVHPAGFLLSAFMGAGLTFAGLTGTCALASLLGAMPWNRTGGATSIAGASCASGACTTGACAPSGAARASTSAGA